MSTKYTKEILQDAVDNSVSFAGVVRYLGLKQAGGTQAHINRVIKKFDIDTSHFTGKLWSKGRTNLPKLAKEQILVVSSEGSPRTRRRQLLRCMLESGLEYKCRCGIESEWQDESITLEIDHINGEWLDNRIQNLRFLCPNCHSQEKTSNRPHKNKQA